MAKFVDNAEFYQLLVEYKNTADINHADYNLKRNKAVHNRLGEIFLLMVNKLLYSPKFMNYSSDWKSEMSSEAVYNCCRYFRNFDVVNNSNPFAYFTTVIWNSFLQMLNKEKKVRMQREVVIDHTWNDILHLLPSIDNPIVMEDSKEVSESV